MATVVRTVTTFTDFNGRRADGRRIDRIIPQFDGSHYAGFNCAASSEAVRDIVENARRPDPGSPWEPTPAFIRRETQDTVGGLRPTQTAAVSWVNYRIGSDIRIVDTGDLRKKLWSRYGATLLVRYGPFADAGYGGSPGFRSNHSFFALGIRRLSDGDEQLLISDSLRDGRRAGIPEGPVWVNLKVIQDCLSHLDLGSGVSLIERYGSHHAYCSFTLTPLNVPPPPTEVELAYGARKIRPKRLRCQFNRTIVRSSPKRIAGNHHHVVDRGDTFDAYQRVENRYGTWVGNKAGTRWVFRSGYTFLKYI